MRRHHFPQRPRVGARSVHVHTVYEDEVMGNALLFASYEIMQVLTQPLYGVLMSRS